MGEGNVRYRQSGQELAIVLALSYPYIVLQKSLAFPRDTCTVETWICSISPLCVGEVGGGKDI
jgi:hypothetical protein